MRVFIEPIIQKCHPVCNANEKFLNRIRRTITVASRAFVHTTAKFFRSSRFRDGCTLLRSPKRAFCKKRVACIRRLQFKGLGFPNKHFATQNGLCIYEDTACHCYERLSNCKMIFQLLYWAYRKFSGGCRNDRTDNANREQTLPHLRRASCRIPAAPNDRRTRAAKHGR